MTQHGTVIHESVTLVELTHEGVTLVELTHEGVTLVELTHEGVTHGSSHGDQRMSTPRLDFNHTLHTLTHILTVINVSVFQLNKTVCLHLSRIEFTKYIQHLFL